ncbi:MAG: penicillin-binding protein activator [Pseudomonadota bacterium]
MKPLSTIRRGLLYVAVFLITVSACAAAEQSSQSDTALLEKARNAERGGSYAVAAREYLNLATVGDPAARYEYLLKAAEAFYRGSFLAQAKNTLASLPAPTLTPQQLARRQTLVAAIAIAERDPAAALKNTDAADSNAEIHQLRAMAYTQTGKPLESVRERIALTPLLTDPNAIRRNNQQLWQSLLGLPQSALENLRPAPPPDTLNGWLALLRIVKTPPAQGFGIEQRIDEWRRLYPQHPATADLIDSLLARQPERLNGKQPRHIALLLPLSGAFATAAEAVRDGFLAAYFQREQTAYQPVIQIYDSGENPAQAAQLYARAVADGADFVVGPLSKEGVTALRQYTALSVPALALNYSDDSQPAPANFFQFGLAPEDEARQVAERAWLDGHVQALAIVPAGEWGGRVLRAFQEHWQQLGGRLVAAQNYETNANDFSAPLRRLLNIDASENRARALRAALQTDLKSEPRRRQDADFVFMAAFPRQARQIPSQLKFFYAGDLPVYTTSHIYEGRADPGQDRDLDGVSFTDIPWLLDDQALPLRDAVEQAWPGQAGLRRLAALGADAFRLIPYLDSLRSSPYEEFSGATGRLTLDANNRIHRAPLWARFSKGVPKLLPPAAPQ